MHFYLAYGDATCAEKTNARIVPTVSLPSIHLSEAADLAFCFRR